MFEYFPWFPAYFGYILMDHNLKKTFFKWATKKPAFCVHKACDIKFNSC